MSKIPKVIHYCWFGPNPLPEIFEKCYESWKKYCPDFEIKFWNEENFDVNANEYLSKTYKLNKFSKISNYARLKIIYENGGVYLDIDVELIKSIDELLNHDMYLGFEDEIRVNTGLGFGAVQGHELIKKMMENYENETKKINKDYRYETCPVFDSKKLVDLGFELVNKYQIYNKIIFLPTTYLNPKGFRSNETNFTENTISIHHFSNTWFDRRQRINQNIISFFDKTIGNIFGVRSSRRISKIFNYSVNFFFRIKNHGIKKTLIFMKKKLFRRNNNG